VRLDANDTVAGVPVLKMRALLRRWGDLSAGAGFIADVLGVPKTKALAILKDMVAEGLVVEADAHPADVEWFVCTTKGNAFAQATTAKPLHRANVEKKLAELVNRMVHVNASSDFLVGIEDAHVYGSYLTDADRLGDLDVSIRFLRKETDPKRFVALANEAARESGRRFNTYLDMLCWPETKALLFLKQRSRVFSLHVNEPLLEDASVLRRAILAGGRPVAPATRPGATRSSCHATLRQVVCGWRSVSATGAPSPATLRVVHAKLAEYGDAFELHVSIRDIEPIIWRRLRVPADLTLGQLHEVLQLAFGWTNSHLHDFAVHDVRFGMVDVEDQLFSVDENAAPLGAVARAGKTFLYRYDFGDDWEHDVKVERVLDQGDERIVCLDGARACPPEDCGSTSGYAHMLEVLANPKDEEYREMKQWVGRGYDPEKFDLAAVNKKLATLSKRLGRRRK
jgi:predicted nucleotidyltransferase